MSSQGNYGYPGGFPMIPSREFLQPSPIYPINWNDDIFAYSLNPWDQYLALSSVIDLPGTATGIKHDIYAVLQGTPDFTVLLATYNNLDLIPTIGKYIFEIQNVGAKYRKIGVYQTITGGDLISSYLLCMKK